MLYLRTCDKYLKVSELCHITDYDSPRQYGVSGRLLPNPRLVSNLVHRGIGPEVLQLDVTLFLMQWGQFTDHDVVLTPAFTGK